MVILLSECFPALAGGCRGHLAPDHQSELDHQAGGAARVDGAETGRQSGTADRSCGHCPHDFGRHSYPIRASAEPGHHSPPLFWSRGRHAGNARLSSRRLGWRSVPNYCRAGYRLRDVRRKGKWRGQSVRFCWIRRSKSGLSRRWHRELRLVLVIDPRSPNHSVKMGSAPSKCPTAPAPKKSVTWVKAGCIGVEFRSASRTQRESFSLPDRCSSLQPR